MESNTAKNFALQLGSLISLYVSVASLLTLLFGIITIMYPDAADPYYVYNSASAQIRFSIATLIVFFPTYLVLTRVVQKVRRREEGKYLTLTKWLIYLSLLVAGAVLLGDLVAVINAFLNGELTTRFLLKVLSILVVVGAAFFYYLLDARGYWQKHEKESIQYAMATTAVVLAVLVLGFFHTETPKEVREMRIDGEVLTDLQNIQWRIEDYYRTNEELPNSVEAAFSGISSPTSPEGRTPYEYNVLSETSFELCGEFMHESQQENYLSIARPFSEDSTIKNPNNWDHGTGEWCFERIISEARS